MNSVTDKSKQSTRDIILRAIKRNYQATVEELAEAADVSPVTVRHHLNSLKADGLLVSESVRRKVGRPYHVYSLSERGQELFPKRYARLSSRLLNELKDRFPAETVADLFSSVVDGIVEEHRHEFEGLPFEERLSYLVDLLGEEGFLARWEKEGDEYRLIEYSCPYMSVGQNHAEICTFDTELIISVLETEVNKQSCMLEGDNCCEFSFTHTQVVGADELPVLES